MTETMPIRVLHVITRMILGGAQENTLLTVEGLDEMPGYHVDLVSGVDSGTEGELVTRAQKTTRLSIIPDMVRGVRPLGDLRSTLKLYRLIRDGNYTIVHTHCWKASIVGRIAAWFARTPVVVHSLHGLTYHDHQPWLINRAIRLSEKICAPMTDHYISVSDVTTEKSLKAKIDRADKYTTVYSGMELDWFLNSEADPLAVRRELGISATAPVVGTIARLVPQKNHNELLKAAPSVVRRHPGVRFLLIGDGPLHAEVLAEVRRLGIEENFVFAGLVGRERIPDMISAMDVVAHTGLWEGLPRVLPQALAMGKPCVAFDVDGTREVLIDGKTGYLIRTHDSAAMAEAISNLLDDEALRRAMGEAGRRHVDPNFRAEKMVTDISDIYQELLSRLASRVEKFNGRAVANSSRGDGKRRLTV